MIETEHRGYTITFDEDCETWKCRDLAIAENVKLSAIKRRIDEMLKSERKVNVPALMANRTWNSDVAQISQVTVTVLCEPEGSYNDKDLKVRSAWIKGKDGRTKVGLDKLIPVECRADLQAWVRLDTEACKAREAAEHALASIRKHDADSLMLAAKESVEAEIERQRAALTTIANMLPKEEGYSKRVWQTARNALDQQEATETKP